ncbi:hypothetical protein DIPPA_07031 [Diplonema papillatum]|nr:hypothetical protein DIPPA_07031 [Diplonema papillatum]
MKKLKRHHCRICYRAVCGTCSTAKQEQHRICDWCHVEHTFETKAWLTGVAESPAFRSYWSLKLEKLSFDLRKMDEPNKDPAASNGSAGARTGAMSSRSDATDIEVRALDLNLP